MCPSPMVAGRQGSRCGDDFIEGEKAHGRPVGLALDRTGPLLIADELGNMVWHVSAR